MVLMPEPIFAAVEAVDPPRPLLYLGPAGRRFDQAEAQELSSLEAGFSLLCGRYEGVDERVREHLCDGELSIGDVVLAGGEVAAMVVIEAVGRLVPGVMGNEVSAEDESFSDGLLEYPHYTRPAEFRGWDGARGAALAATTAGSPGGGGPRRSAAPSTCRPDLIESRGGVTPEERSLLAEFGLEDDGSGA